MPTNAKVIGRQLHYLWKVMVTQEVPEDWKKANVIPTYKKGKKGELWTCSLVSLISIPGKVREKLILETVSRYMKKQVGQRSCGMFTYGDIKNATGHCTSSLFQQALFVQGGWTRRSLEDLQKTLWISTILWFHEDAAWTMHHIAITRHKSAEF